MKKILTFLSQQAYFASWHLCCRYIRQSTKHMQQSSKNAYNYYVKLFLDLIGVYSASWIISSTKISIVLVFYGEKSKTQGVRTFSAIVPIICGILWITYVSSPYMQQMGCKEMSYTFKWYYLRGWMERIKIHQQWPTLDRGDWPYVWVVELTSYATVLI